MSNPTQTPFTWVSSSAGTEWLDLSEPAWRETVGFGPAGFPAYARLGLLAPPPPGPRRWRCSRRRRARPRQHSPTGGSPPAPPEPSAAPHATSRTVAAPRGTVPGATRARSHGTGSGATGPAGWWDASRTARGRVRGPRCRVVIRGSRSGGTSRRVRPDDTTRRPARDSGAGRSRSGRGRPGGRTWSDRQGCSYIGARRGLW